MSNQGDQLAVTSDFYGFVESLECNKLIGWAVDKSRPSKACYVAIVIDDDVIAVAQPTQYRPDVNAAIGFAAPSQFEFFLDEEYLDKVGDIIVAAVDAKFAYELLQACRHRDAHLSLNKISFSEFVDNDSSTFHLLKNTDRLLERIATKRHKSQNAIKKSSRILFEISDLLFYLHNHTTVTGIQRTECGVMISLIGSVEVPNDNFAFCSVTEQLGFVQVFDNEDLLTLLSKVFSGLTSVEELTVTIKRAKENSSEEKVCANDTVFVLGAYWVINDIERQLQTFKVAGAVIGTYIYDIIPITSSQFVETNTALAFCETASSILSIADFIITISNYVKSDVEKLLENELASKKPISVTPLPHKISDLVDTNLQNSSQRAAPGYVLCVCTLEPRKNHLLLYRVWANLIRKHGFDQVPSLILVGRWGWRMDDFRQACERSKYLNGKIVIKNDISDFALAKLYRDCLITVFPSFVEGWGLPVGESLCFNKLCISSNASSIPEVGGGLVDYFSPHDYDEAFQKIECAIYNTDYRLIREKQIVEKFIPRKWIDTSTSLVTKIGKFSGERRKMSSDKCVFPPVIAQNKIFNFGQLLLSEIASWNDKLVRFALFTGWSRLETWGVWSNEPTATIKFRSSLAAGTRIYIGLKLMFPDLNMHAKVEVSVSGKSPFQIEGQANKAHWHVFEGSIDEDSSVNIVLRRPRSYFVKDGERRIFLGLSDLAYCNAHTPNAERDFLATIGNVKLLSLT